MVQFLWLSLMRLVMAQKSIFGVIFGVERILINKFMELFQIAGNKDATVIVWGEAYSDPSFIWGM